MTTETKIPRLVPINDPVIRPAQVASMLGISTTTLWRWRRQRGFPPAMRLGATMVGWRLSEIHNWIDDLPRAASND